MNETRTSWLREIAVYILSKVLPSGTGVRRNTAALPDAPVIGEVTMAELVELVQTRNQAVQEVFALRAEVQELRELNHQLVVELERARLANELNQRSVHDLAHHTCARIPQPFVPSDRAVAFPAAMSAKVTLGAVRVTTLAQAPLPDSLQKVLAPQEVTC